MGWNSTSLHNDILRAIVASEVLEMHLEQDEAQQLHNFIYDMLSDGHDMQNILDGSVTYHGQQGSGEKHDVDLENSLCSSHRVYVALCPPGPRRHTPPLSFDPTSPNLTPRARRTRDEDVGEEEKDAEGEDERRCEKERLGKCHAGAVRRMSMQGLSHPIHLINPRRVVCLGGRDISLPVLWWIVVRRIMVMMVILRQVSVTSEERHSAIHSNQAFPYLSAERYAC